MREKEKERCKESFGGEGSAEQKTGREDQTHKIKPTGEARRQWSRSVEGPRRGEQRKMQAVFPLRRAVEGRRERGRERGRKEAKLEKDHATRLWPSARPPFPLCRRFPPTSIAAEEEARSGAVGRRDGQRRRRMREGEREGERREGSEKDDGENNKKRGQTKVLLFIGG